MNPIHKLGRDFHRLLTVRRVEPSVAATKAEHLGNAVAVMQFQKERTNNVIEAGTQSAARDDAGTRLLRVEEELRARSSQLELQPRLGADFDPLRNANGVADRVALGGVEARRAENGYVH